MTVVARKIESVRRRYLMTLFSNAVFFFLSVVTAGVVPRALGPKALGDFGFLNRVASAFRNMLNMGTSSAFYNYNSKHEHTGSLVKAYSAWILGQLFAIVSLILLSVVIGFKDKIWPGQDLRFILWVAIFDWVFFTASLLKQLADSKGYTTKAQIINFVIGVVNIFLLVLFAVKGRLNLAWYVGIQTFTSACISLGIIILVIAPHKDIYWAGKVKGHLKEFADYFYKFCSPLVAITVMGFAFEYFDRVFLQAFSGSVEQGYFHIASSWSALATLFAASFLSIYKREVASAMGQSDIKKASSIFTRYLKMLYFVTLTLTIFLAFNAGELLALIAGPKFTAAAPALVIMAFYPLHQVYGQLGGAAFYSTERTRVLRDISVIGMLAGIVMSYFFLAPSSMAVPGLGLGATGLAIKTVLWNLIIVQIYLVANCRFFGIDSRPFFRHQLYTVLLLAVIMLSVKVAASMLIQGGRSLEVIVRLGAQGFLYFGIISAVVYMFPAIGGITREDITSLLKRVFDKFKGYGQKR